MSDAALEKVIAELKTRGLRAGEAEGQRLIDDANDEAARIVDKARQKAERIVNEAESKAASTRAQLDAELRRAAAVGIEAFRQAMEHTFLVPELNEDLKSVFADSAFLQEVILAVAEAFAASHDGGADLTLLLPEAQREKLGEGFIQKLRQRALSGAKIEFDDGFELGFRIAPEGTTYHLDFDHDGFLQVFMSFLAPRFRECFVAQTEH